MKLFFAVMLVLAALLLAPVMDQALGDFAFRPNLQLALLAVCVSLCPGPAAVIGCGLLGLILDCLAGPQLGARAAGFCLLAALGSIAVERRADSWPARVAGWMTILFVAELLSRIVASASLGMPFRPAAALNAALSAMSTTIFVSCLWLAGSTLSRLPRLARSNRRFAPAIGRAGN
ncbi:MAG TPA: hypothetical protein VEI07_14440 [Planctomycetaceae bacterium]|nr:hypothetical protein [Planctomycetaceae bacterium]